MSLVQWDIHMQKDESRFRAMPFTKLNSKIDITLNIKHQIMKLLENDMRQTSWFGFGDDFLDTKRMIH